MSTDPVFVVRVFGHPTREAPEKSTMQLYAEVATGALNDAEIAKADVDGYYTVGVPEYKFALQPLTMADYLGLEVAWIASTDVGGSSYLSQMGHAASAIRDSKCDICLVTMAGRPQSRRQASRTRIRELHMMQHSFERIYGATSVSAYAIVARRHIHEYGTI